jgi:hypothetical protein
MKRNGDTKGKVASVPNHASRHEDVGGVEVLLHAFLT